jgi:hypothetical protein
MHGGWCHDIQRLIYTNMGYQIKFFDKASKISMTTLFGPISNQLQIACSSKEKKTNYRLQPN